MQLDSDRPRAVFATAVLSVSNIVADLVCVFVFDGGLWGIGLATAVSYCIAAGVLLLHFVKPNASFTYLPESMHVKNLREMFLSGMTMILGRGSSVLCVSILTRISLSTAGGAGVAAFAACWNFLTMIQLLPVAVAASTQMISGLLIGEHDKPSPARLIKIALKYSLAISAIMTPVVFLAAPTIASLYVHDADATTYQMTLEGLRWLSTVILMCAMALMFNYYCVAAGKLCFATVTTILNNIGILPFALILTPYFGMTGLWIAFPLRYIALVLLVVAVTCYYCRRITFRLEDYLLLPADFDISNDKQLNMTVIPTIRRRISA